ncbi:MAG: hypothetical protein R3C10_18300 [Pirellulales bacterium]
MPSKSAPAKVTPQVSRGTAAKAIDDSQSPGAAMAAVVAGESPARHSSSDAFWSRPEGADARCAKQQLPEEDHDHDYARQAAAWDEESGEIVESAKQNAPAWLASTVLHVSIMLMLALWAWHEPATRSFELLISELPGDQMIDDSVPLDVPDATDKEQALALSTLEAVDDPLSARAERRRVAQS